MHFVDSLPPGRHRRDPGLGAGAFPARRARSREFDGTALYEHADPRLGEHADWGTQIFNYGRHEVRNFLVANALFWLDRYHMTDCAWTRSPRCSTSTTRRKAGEWAPNRHGGRENLEAIDFLRQLNVPYGRYPGVMTIAEESTAFPAVTRPTTSAVSASALSGTWAG